MATSDYKNALTNMRNFILGGGYVAGTMSGKDVDPKTGKRKQATDSIMARSPTPKDTKTYRSQWNLAMK